MSLEEWLDLPELVDKVQELLELGFLEDAKKLLDQYSQVFHNYWEVYFLYSRVFTEQNMPRKAVLFLLDGLRLDRTNADCLLGLFYAHAMMDQVKKGGKFLLKAQKHHPQNELILSALIWYYIEINQSQKAVLCFKQAQEINTNNPETFRNGGIAYDRLGRYEEAENCYKTALEINPGFDEARDLLAELFIFTNRTNEAIRLYEDALKDSPKNIRIMSKLVFCLSHNDQLDKAAAAAKMAITMYPNSPIGYIDLAYINLNTDRTDEAIEMAEKAISVAPIDAEGYRVMGIAFSDKKDFETAEDYFAKAITLDPQNSDTLRDYYQHLRNAGKYEQMVEIVKKVIEFERPYCIEDYCFLADYYRGEMQNTKAFHYLHRAYKSMPAEKDLIPPMIGILFERGHVKYGMSMFASFIEKSGGWNETMNPFTYNKQLRDRFSQEGLRFLRFNGEKPVEFRRYIFKYYLSHYALMYYSVIACALTFPASVIFGWRGIISVAVVYAVSMTAFKLYRIWQRKKALVLAEQAAATLAKGSNA
ncbi:MAG: tetratricopeptide repeat protein [Chitinispirillales bacterium]|jgi:tetratricopeptide (TPR) repeat protein|nr:tetratricopeptide repeat protein [Chitinispirillales bacterium]